MNGQVLLHRRGANTREAQDTVVRNFPGKHKMNILVPLLDPPTNAI